MLDYLLTALLPLVMLVILFYGSKKDKKGDFFFSKDYTTVLKGLCCIFIVIGHTPDEYKNNLQDMLSSFGYIRVTLFFMMTGYGLSLCENRKAGYMRSFWRNRLASLLIPGLLVNVAALFIHQYITGGYNIRDLIFIDPYISVLLQYYIFFYIVHYGKKIFGEKTGNIILVIGVTLSSILDYLLNDAPTRAWPYERMGIVWGIILYFNFRRIKEFVTPKAGKIVIFFLLCMVLGLLYVKSERVYFWSEYLLKIVLGAIIITFLFLLSSNRTWGNRAMAFFGDIYYEVFLSHMLMIQLVKTAYPDLSSGEFILTVASLTIIFSAFIHYLGQPVIRLCRTKKTKQLQENSAPKKHIFSHEVGSYTVQERKHA